MGLLDDAIREHLELKRRHGGDASEIARQEREALGAPRSAAEAAQGSAAAELDAPTATAAVDPVAREPDLPRDPDREPAGGAVAVDRFADDDLDWSDPAPPDPPESEAAADEEGEDVLEETPEFLQETPEHDRLWFEQRPPRDFDF
jgi:hypothetical protein